GGGYPWTCVNNCTDKKMNQIKEINPMANFTIEEVVALLNLPVIKQNRTEHFQPENIGLIVGVLTLNDEVEMVVKFIDHVTQFTKREFNKQYRVIQE
uniref:hypothetical protein n=1 Tax=uncultured Rheinheimera sp. TaxID=400532 RepID=UPI00259AC001